MIVRSAKINDLPQILNFSGRKRKDWHVNQKKFVKSYIQNKHNFFFIGIDNKKVIGSVAGELWDDKGFAYIGEITAEGKNKKEIVKKLFDYLVRFCKKKNITLLNSYVNQRKIEKIKTYQTLGMKKRGDYFYFEKII